MLYQEDTNYLLAEYKGLIDFLRILEVKEGEHPISGRFGSSDVFKEHIAQITEEQRNEYIKEFQDKIDAIQEEIDMFNFTTEIPWGDEPEKINIPEEKE